jgi:polysaccharide export outer membrane protein
LVHSSTKFNVPTGFKIGGAVLLSLMMAGCGGLGAAGPRTSTVLSSNQSDFSGSRVQVITLTDEVARRVLDSGQNNLLSEAIGDAPPLGSVVGYGDVLDFSVWEAPPAVLFGVSAGSSTIAASVPNSIASAASGRNASFPEQMVDEDGEVTVPFVGQVRALGLPVNRVAADITERLRGIANHPQVIVRIIRNANANVTVVGDVNSATRLILSPRGERLLDALAAAGGVRQSVDKITIQVTRGSKTSALPLETIIKDPSQNIRLASNDVITALYQPYSFTALGAAGNNSEIGFEGVGLTLAQALGRMGGLRDDRASPKGVFIFRLEDPAALGPESAHALTTTDGKIPVIYRADLTNPATFFAAQGFPVRNRDVIYISNAPLSDFQKFVSLVSQLATTGLTVGATVP